MSSFELLLTLFDVSFKLAAGYSFTDLESDCAVTGLSGLIIGTLGGEAMFAISYSWTKSSNSLRSS